MRRLASAVLIVLGLQAVLAAAYVVVTRSRETAVRAVQLDAPSPELVYRTFDDGEARLSDLRGSRVLVHFWATWCPPCREELPALLEFAAASDVRVLAVSVDPAWSDVRAFLGTEPPPEVVLAASTASAERFGVETLPESYLVDGRGRLRLRLAGARDWSADAVRELILDDDHDEQ